MKKLLTLVFVLGLILGGYFTWQHFFGVESVSVDEAEQIEKISEYANPEAFITPGQLNELLQDESSDVVVIGSLNPTANHAPIEGSFTMWRNDYSADESVYDFEGMRNETEEMEGILSSYGATAESTIVVYAANEHHDAARLWWQIKMLGHEDVRYLDGGLNAWQGANLPTGNANEEVTASDYVAPNPSFEMLAELEDVIAAQGTEIVILDTRTVNEEQGETTASGAFGPGKIANAPFIGWDDSLYEDTTMKSVEDLAKVYGDYEGKEIITYCQSGVRSAHTLLVLTQALGYENVTNYDGSWVEWSYEYYEQNNSEVLVEHGNK